MKSTIQKGRYNERAQTDIFIIHSLPFFSSHLSPLASILKILISLFNEV